MFTHISELPKDEGWYVCRCIDENGNVRYRLDEFCHPTVFQEKYEGITNGFQLDFGNSLKTEAWMKINDDYSNHIIRFDKDRKTSIIIKSLEMTLEIGDLKKVSDGEPTIYHYPIVGCWDNEVFTSFILIYQFNNDYKVVIEDGKLKEIINNSNDPVLKEYIEKYFSRYLINCIFKKDYTDNIE